MPLTLMGIGATALVGGMAESVRRAESVQEALKYERPTYFSDGEKDLMTGEKCILERAGDGWVTYDPKTYRPMSAYGKYDRRFWNLWTEVIHYKEEWMKDYRR